VDLNSNSADLRHTAFFMTYTTRCKDLAYTCKYWNKLTEPLGRMLDAVTEEPRRYLNFPFTAIKGILKAVEEKCWSSINRSMDIILRTSAPIQ
jgi:hypothetical protein